MPVRMDKFAVNDVVVWEDSYARIIDGVERFGAGPFRIVEVINRLEGEPSFDGRQTTWESMGHTQHVHIDADEDTMFSGAFFVKAPEAE